MPATSSRHALSSRRSCSASYAFFWHSRDWNTASRLMLTYALVDRGTVSITGLDQQTGDKAKFHGQYYSDKLPGYPLLATLPYACAKWAVAPAQPSARTPKARNYWPADYWITLGTSGLFTAGTAVLLVLLARELGCSPGDARPGRPRLRSVDAGVRLRDARLRTPGVGLRPVRVVLPVCGSRRRPREPLRLVPRRLPGGLRGGDRAPGRPGVGDPGFLPAGAMPARRRAGPDALGLFAMGAIDPDPDPADLQPARLRLALGHGLFSSPVAAFADVHNARQSARLEVPVEFWHKLRPSSGAVIADLLFYAPILLLTVPGWVVLDRPPDVGPGGRDLPGGRRGRCS